MGKGKLSINPLARERPWLPPGEGMGLCRKTHFLDRMVFLTTDHFLSLAMRMCSRCRIRK